MRGSFLFYRGKSLAATSINVRGGGCKKAGAKKENLIFLFLKNKKFFTLRVSVKDSLEGGCAGEITR
jgi:hypothetical protein